MMKRFLLYFISFLLFRQAAYAEGTKELAPNSTDITSLLINSSTYGTFAAYNGPVDSRLNFRIINPGSEQVFLGFSTWINDAGSYGCWLQAPSKRPEHYSNVMAMAKLTR